MARNRRNWRPPREKTEAKMAKAEALAEAHPAKPLGNRGRWVMGEDGEWREGKAEPEQLPPELASMPGEIVTKDTSDPDRAHELDPPHVIEAYAYDHQKAIDEAEKPKAPDPMQLAQEMEAPVGEVVPLTQGRVDMVRWRVGRKMLEVWLDRMTRGVGVDVDEPKYLWFEDDNVNAYELRHGKPPRNRQRPRHMRNIRLEVRPLDPPRSIRALFEAAGVRVPDACAVVDGARRDLVQAAIKEMVH